MTSTYLHSGWEFVQSGHQGQKVGTVAIEWLPASVPGHVHLDLVENGIINHPFERQSELGCQWVDEADWSYRTKFEWSPKLGLENRVLLFEGLDTVCSIYLNGELVGTHNNMFVPLEISVSDRLIVGENELRIEFESAARVGRERRAVYFKNEGLLESQQNFPERAFVRKAQYMSGWDWGPRLVSCGIWRPIRLVEFASRITDVHAVIKRQSPSIFVVSLSTQVAGAGTVVHYLDGAGCRIGDGDFVLSDPELWSPESPVTYSLSSAILPVDADLAHFEIDWDTLEDDSRSVFEAITRALLVQNGHDMREQELGFREIELVREPDQWGESFGFELNGAPIWARGANWIPDHSFPSLVSKARYREQLEKCVDMGFNMLRVWGGGLYETDEFYELCDELGILVWQDFPFACSFYPDDSSFQSEIAVEAEYNVRRLRNHPCLALWCGNNENHEMYENAWGGSENLPPRYYGLPIYDVTLPNVLAELDAGRAYIPSSPIGALNQTESDSTQPVIDAKRRGPNGDGYGDQHNWDVWHGRGDWRFYSDSKGRFSSEYGFASSPTMECWSRAQIGDLDDYHGPTVRWHDKTAKGHETFVGYVELHYPKSVTLSDWSYYSQLNQRDALRHGVEHYRRSEFCRGSLIWQVNDCWPVQSWAILDFLGNYKALAYELRRLHADQLLSIERQDRKMRLWACNDGRYAWPDAFSLTAYDTVTGELRQQWQVEAEVGPNRRAVVLEIDLTGLNVNRTIVLGEAGSVEEPVWRLLGEPKNAMLAPPSPLIASVSEDGLVTVQTATPLVDLMLLDNGSVGNLLDNFITAPEPSVFAARVTRTPTALTARSLAGTHPITLTRSPL